VEILFLISTPSEYSEYHASARFLFLLWGKRARVGNWYGILTRCRARATSAGWELVNAPHDMLIAQGLNEDANNKMGYYMRK